MRALLAALVVLLAQDPPRTGMKPPEEVEKTFTLAPGIALATWAREPQLVNPTCIDIDERGRVWVAEAVNYRKSLLAPEGDRIVILDDPEGAGRCTRAKVFVQDKSIVAPLGICVLGNKVYVAQSPKMLVYTVDASGDQPVGPPEVLFDGFGGVNSDHGLHSIVAGPDGRFYFNAGNSGCDGARILNAKGEPIVDSTDSEVGGKGQKFRGGPRALDRRYFQGMAFRCNPDGTGFETLGHNFRNNYEVAVDSYGTAWQSDNDDDGNQGVRINYVMEGGNFGYVGPKGSNWSRDQAAHPGQTRQEAHWHQRDPGVVPNLLMTGAGSPAGICVYEGDLLPDLRGRILHADAGPNVVRIYSPTPAGAGYKCASAELLKSSYNWVRPVDVCVGVDGAVFVADWTDPGVGGHATGDTDPATISGRLYRLAPPGHRATVPPLDLSTVKGQIAALCSPNLARRWAGYQKLAAGGREASLALRTLFKDGPDATHRARALWILARLPDGRDALRDALQDKDVNLRVTALRALRQAKADMIEIASAMSADPDLFVARELCLALAYEPTAKALPILVRLADKVQPHSPANDLSSKDFAEQEQARQDRVVAKWYLEALGIACQGREKEVLEEWKRTGKTKDEKVAEALTWRLAR